MTHGAPRPKRESRLVVLGGEPARAPGTVWLVGAGPGDPDLLTIKALRALQAADVVVHDGLVTDQILDLARPGARLISVAKRKSRHSYAQDEIDRMLVAFAREGLTVVRLKGGDPFVFGRGGEEALALSAAGVPFEVVPGITSAIAAPAYAGIPVTHRNVSAQLAIVTGHERPGKETSEIDWDVLARFRGTLVFLMGVGRLGDIAGALIENGKDPATPAAVVQSGTLPAQRTVSGPLSEIAAIAQQAGIRAPAVTVVGQVAGLRAGVAWAESRPLHGRTIA
ncbi:uroporphyrinogen-III C-methyltransferase, partial [Phenylobacterium sp.]|uniref:uroporphyrinogen-III C-methyltransferase n=1 Tax=Phenylobacterium sp. TaxID=1871053 RepID=UPI002F41F247